MNCTHTNCFKLFSQKTCMKYHEILVLSKQIRMLPQKLRCADAVVASWMSFGTRSSSRRNANVAWNTREGFTPTEHCDFADLLRVELLRVNSWTFLLFRFIGVFVPNLPRCFLAHSIQSHLRNNHDHLLPTSTRTLPILFWNRTNASNFCRNWSRSVNRFFRRSNKYTSAWRNAQKRAPAKRQRLFLYLQDLFLQRLFFFCASYKR